MPAVLLSVGSTAAFGTAVIQRVTAYEDAIAVTGALQAASSKPTTVAVYELSAAYNTASLGSSRPVAQAIVPAGRTAFRASFARRDGGRDRLYEKFLATDSGQPAGTAHYVDDFEFAAANNYPYPHVSSIKGVQPLELEDDAEETGTRHAGLNVVPSLFMLKQAGDAATTITFHFDGADYYFDRSQIEALDHRTLVLTHDGIQVHFVVYLLPNASATSAASILIHPDADTTQGGPVYGFNTKTEEGIRYVTAAFAFLARRYTRMDERYGRAVDFIIGNEIDSMWAWQNMGEQTLPDFIEYYTRALRLAYLALRSAYAHPRVYISLDHYWTISNDASQPLRWYKGKDTFDQLNGVMKQEGDVPWQVAYHPYPQDLTDPYFWRDDTEATDNVDTEYITFKNLQVLSEYVELPANRYEGEVRTISCSEEGVNLPADPTLTEEQNEQVQAAAYAYAFYKLRFTPHVESFILYRQVTDSSESLRMSLWALDPERAGESAGEPRLIHKIYTYIDTPESLAMTQFALPIIGINSWSDAIPGFDASKVATQPLPEEQVGAEKFAAAEQGRTIADFRNGTAGWVYADGADSVASSSGNGYEGGGELTVAFSTNYGNLGETKFWRGAEEEFRRPLDASADPYLTLALNVPAPQPGEFKPGNVFYAKVKVYGPREHVAAGVVRLDPTQGWTPIAVDLSHWRYRSEISKIKVWVRGTTDDNWIGTFAISKVALARGIGASSVPNVDFAVSAVQPAGVGTAATVEAINNGTQPLSGTATVQDCAQVGLNPASFNLAGVPPSGGTQGFQAAFSDYGTSAQTPQVCVDYAGESLTAPLQLLPAPPLPFSVLYDFEDGTEAWNPGQNIASVATVSSFANGPTTPVHGNYALEATGTVAAANAPKSVVLTPASPLNLTGKQNFVAYVDAYGLYAGDTFSAFITLTSGSQTISTTMSSFQPNQWNKVVLDISHWAYANSVTKIEIGFECTNETIPWNPRFQVDFVGTNP